MIGILRMNIIYTGICTLKLGSQEIEKIENLMLLLQAETLALGMKPLLNYPIYIHDNTIRVKYLSDLLRVRKNMVIHYRGISATKVVEMYQPLLSKFRNIPDEEINIKVNELILNGNLDKKYFVCKEYNNFMMRRIARLEANRDVHKVASFVRTMFVTIPTIVLFFAILMGCFMIEFNPNIKMDIDELYSFALFEMFLVLILVIWSWIWSRPLKNEIL